MGEAAAEKRHRRLLPLMKDLFIEPNPVPVKTALEWSGVMSSEVRLPLCAMGETTRERLRKTLEAFQRDGSNATSSPVEKVA